MDYITLLKDTPVPALLIMIGGIFLFVGFATIEKPIIIKVDPKRRKSATVMGVALLTVGIGLYVSPQGITKEADATSTPTIEPTLTAAFQDTPIVATLPSNTPEVFITETSIPVVVNGLENGCINIEFWMPYTANRQFPHTNNCWDLSSKGITTYKNELLFAVKNTIEQSGSIYMMLPESGTISFNLKIDRYTIGGENGNFVMGFGNSSEWLQRGKFIFLRMKDSGSPVYYVYGNSVTQTSGIAIRDYKIGTSQKIIFEVKSLILNIYIDENKVVPTITLLPNERKVFWIGYRLPQNSELVASIDNFVIEK